MSSSLVANIENPYGKNDDVLCLTLLPSQVYKLENVISIAGKYTFSIWCKSASASTISLNILGTEDVVRCTTSWQKYVKTVESANAAIKDIEIKSQENITTYFYEGSLVDGVIDTSWLPAPEDIDESVRHVESTFTQRADSIEAEVSETNGDVANLKLTSSQIQAAIVGEGGDITNLDLATGGLAASVKNNAGDISNVRQSADEIVISLVGEGRNISEIDITDSGLASTVRSNSGEISALKQEVGKISMAVTGSDSMASYEITDKSIVQRVEENSGDISEVKQSADELKIALVGENGDLSTFTNTTGGFSSVVSKVQTDLSGVETTITNSLSYHDGVVTIGNSNSAITLKQQHNKVWFERKGDAEPVAYILVDENSDFDGKLFITKGEFVKEVILGNIALSVAPDNGITISKVGVT